MTDEQRWQRIGQWYEQVFSCHFMTGNLPGPKDVMIACRLRVQIENPEGDWEDWR